MKPRIFKSGPKLRVVSLNKLGDKVAGPAAQLETFRIVKRAIEMRDDAGMLEAARLKRERKAARRAKP